MTHTATHVGKGGFSALRARTLVLGAGMFLLALWSTAAAEITVPKLEMASRGRMNDGEFILSSILSADLALTGGYKYAFLLGFSLEAPDIGKAFAYRNFRFNPLLPVPSGGGVTEDDYNALVDKYNAQTDMINNQAVLGFRIAKATARDIFNLPLEVSYFIGSGDDFCTGDEFSSLFGLSPIGTDFRGFFYFPDGIGGIPTDQYNGIYGVRGTGFSFTLTKWANFVPMVYLYQDFAYPGSISGGENLYSGDLRLLLNKGWLKLEGFGGVSAAPGLDPDIRGGLMVHLAAVNGAEFFAQGGVPGWTVGEQFSVDHIFFLIEPRLRFGFFGVTVTFFYHPVEYIHILTPEEHGKADINIKFQFGKTDSASAVNVSGGVETGGNLKIDHMEDFLFYMSPFVSFISGGLKWDIKIRFTPQNYQDPEKLCEYFIGIRTAF